MKEAALEYYSFAFNIPYQHTLSFSDLQKHIIFWFLKCQIPRPNLCTTVKLSSNSFSVVLHKEKVVQLKKLDCEAALSFLKFETFFLRSFVRSFVVLGGETLFVVKL